MKQMKKAAVYCKVASEDDICIGMQKAEILQFAKEQGYENITVYEDIGVSGSNLIVRLFLKCRLILTMKIGKAITSGGGSNGS